jgi:Carboxypeptidase regulatory-like domain/TonB dependent receptor
MMNVPAGHRRLNVLSSENSKQTGTQGNHMNRAIRFGMLTILFILCGFICRMAAAQDISGSLRGTVLDASGAIVSGATVTAVNIETGFSRSTPTDTKGEYLLVSLPVGNYRLEVEAKGFRKYSQEGITLNVNQPATIPVRLVVGTATETLEVKANADLIETTTTSLGTTVGDREVLDLPLNGRHFTQLGLLQPGVAPVTAGLILAGGSLREGQAYAVNGQRPESNNFLVDGADNFNGVDGGFVLQPPVDAIAEFRILTHTASAEFGHSTGSTTNIVTRSGTNNFHGALWEFFRNDALDAKSFFADSVEPLHRNQFGATAGGPIKKDKTFFFAYYEGLRNSQGETRRTTVPSNAERDGDFGQLCGAKQGTFDDEGFCSNPAGQLLFLFTPQPTPVPFNDLRNILGPNPINPISQNILNFYPLANEGTNTFVDTQTLTSDNNQFGVRVDHYLTARDMLNFRYSFSQGSQTDPLSTSGANVPGFPVGENQRSQNFIAQETHTFSPTVVGIARFSYLRNKFLFDEHLNHTTPESLGFEYEPSLEAAIGPPFIQASGYASVGDPITGPRNTYQNSFDFSGSLTWVHGRHQMKFGAGYQYDQINVLQGIATNGFFVFDTFPFTDAFASLEFGQPVFFLQGSGDFSRGLRGHAVNMYAQDTYKLTSRLTLNFGLRYEIPSPYTEVQNRQNLWIPGVQSTVNPDAPTGLLYPGDKGVPRGLIPTQMDAVAPRVGVAWDPTGTGQWLVTAAYGIFYDPYYTGQGGPLQTPISAPPYLQTAQISVPNSFANPYEGIAPPVNGFVAPMTLLTLDPNLRLPYAQDWNLNVERSFGKDWLFQVGYVGTKGTRLPRFVEANPTVYDPDLSYSDNTQFSDQRRLYSGCTLAPDSPPCTFSSAGLISGIANSTYHAMQVSLRKRYSYGLSFLASYTFSKTLDDASTFNITGSASQSTAGENDLAQNPFDVRAEHGRSMFDARHRFVFSYQWNLPWFSKPQNWYEHILGNWMVNGVTTFQSNIPFTVYDSSNPSAQGGAPEISGFFSARPNIIGDPNSGSCVFGDGSTAPVRTAGCWFNTGAFAHAAPGQFGDVGRATMLGPAFQQWDFSAIKMIPIRESMNLQFRAEFFNIFNNVNFQLPNNDINSTNFGQIQSAQSGRIIQFALKFLF